MTKLLVKIVTAAVLATSLSACVYRINILQGNFTEQEDVDKLRVNMTKEQVAYVLGKPVIKDAFNHSTWHYVYDVQYGKGGEVRKTLSLEFTEGKLISMTGDFDKPEAFEQPLQ